MAGSGTFALDTQYCGLKQFLNILKFHIFIYLNTLGGMETFAATLENSVTAPQKLTTKLPYNLAIPRLNAYSTEMKTHGRTKARALVLTATSFHLR